MLLRVSLTTFTSKYSACLSKSALLNSQNLSGFVCKTATPASWTSVEDGCHGWICWRKMNWTLSAYFDLTNGKTES